MPIAVIGSFEHVFEAMFGKADHDAHVKTRRQHLWLKRWEDTREARTEAVWTEVERINAEYRASRAPAHLKIAAE